MNRKNKEGDFYASKVRLFLNEYGGINLEEFCKADRVSYSKMCKSEEHAQEILVSQLNSEKRARRAAEKKAHDAELRISTLLDKVNDL